TNGQSNDRPENITGRRLGGNRMTSYNWEDNFSNGGNDYINDNDNYLPWNAGLPSADYLTPNIVLSAFHDTSLIMNCSSLITLPMAGYVARDGNGVVSSGQAAPSPRWRQVVNKKGSAFSFKPDTTDGFIYVDECMNNLITQFGKSYTAKGIKNYEMDNEWSIWNGSDPLMHPNQPTVAEAISKSTSLAATIKRMDSISYVFGPVDYGYNSYLTFQNATDWSSYSSSYSNFAYAYLHFMKHVSDSIGHRLLDVYDIHYYSSAQGLDNSSTLEVVDGGNNDKGVAIARMEAPRTLWDSTYTENSWIGQYYSPVAYIPAVQYGINKYFPGTKIAFTEYSYGGENDISGGIALADMLGISGRYGVYWCSVWGPVNLYWASGFKIFRNYNGKKGSFGDWHVYGNTNNWRTSSVYASLQSIDTAMMNIVVMNKDYDSTLKATVNITANTKFNKADIYALIKTDTLIHHIGSIAFSGNKFIYTLPTQSVYHFVLTDTTSVTGFNNLYNNNDLVIYPNPSSGVYTVELKVNSEQLKVEVYNMLGEQVYSQYSIPNTQFSLNLSNSPNGIYILRIESANGVVTKKLIKE
ncbi:MAG TPA: glycoside hydrolase family 44 protein, partial [Bacteroidia bacterium]|nr:glycoside hydrolase family 44 protein [Bacteroidia bacterium]